MSDTMYPCMLSGEYFEGDHIAECAEFVLEHPTEPSWGFYRLKDNGWGVGGLACLVNIDVEHARENYSNG